MAAALKVDAADDRLAADLARFPESSTLSGLALRDEAGAVVGRCCPTDALGLAYDAGTDAALIVEAERLAAVIGQPGDRGYLDRAVRLAHAVRAMNRRLRHSIEAQALGTVTVCMTRAGVRDALAAAERAASSSSVPSAPHAHDPPPLVAATTSPHRPCAPPSPRAALLSDGMAVGIAS